jgi:D-alanine-D-alanine ligase
MPKLNVGVIFGGRSVEHEVSIVTGLQVVENVDRTKYDVIPIYVSKEGDWYTGEELKDIKNYKDIKQLLSKVRKVFLPPVPSMAGLYFYPFRSGIFKKEAEFLRLDVIVPAIHGMHGEDGTIQGLFELADIPYAGSGVTGSAVGMDKIIMKDIFKANGIPTVKYTWFLRDDYESNRESILQSVEDNVSYPVFVKPANLGSSIGITMARDRQGLMDAIEVAVRYDRKIIVEEGVRDPMEVNCSCLGLDEDVRSSVCEQPVTWQELLSFEDKYLSSNTSKGMKSASRRIPAPISDEKTAEVRELAAKAFKVLDCSGVARIDFLLEKDTMKVYVNEINTMPGSAAFYLWEPEGVRFKELIDRLIDIALKRHHEKRKNIYTFDSELLKKASSGSLKGVKK